MGKTSFFDPPGHDQLEVTLIGPGYGESLVVHLGGGRWAIVDSCVRPGSKGSAPLEYLGQIGVDAATDVALIVATHWHDDHVRGLASVVRECSNADFCCSVALRSHEFWALVDGPPPPPASRFTSGVAEFRDVIKILDQRSSGPRWASAAKRLLRSNDTAVKAVWALSPADGDVTHALKDFMSSLESMRSISRRAVAWGANDASVVLLIEHRDSSVLLGADLEHRKTQDSRGWHAIVTEPGRPGSVAHLYKVAHHGSGNAHCDAVWDKRCKAIPAGKGLLAPGDTVSIVAPWRLGSGRLPGADDLNRLGRFSREVHLTKDIDTAFGDPQELKTYAAASEARFIAPLKPTPGLLRCRLEPGGTWAVTSAPAW